MILIFLVGIFHALYISYVEIEIHQEVCIMTCKIFSDDLADAVRVETDSIVSREGNYSHNDLSVIKDYIDKHLVLSSETDTITFFIDSYSKEGEAVWIHLKSDDVIEKQMNVHNSILIDVFPDQTNILKIISEEEPRLLKMDRDNTEHELTLKL